MISVKSSALKPLIESSEGIHLSAYLVNGLDGLNLKAQIKHTMLAADLYLDQVLSRQERTKFFQPLQALLNDRRILKGFKGNIGLFRSQNSFRLLKIPIEVEHLCILATSFHVKPLLRWMQDDRDFLLLHLEAEGAKLYQGSQFEFNCIEKFSFAEVLRKEKDEGKPISLAGALRRRPEGEEKIDYLSDWLSELTRQAKPRVFVTGDTNLTEALLKRARASSGLKNIRHAPLFGRKIEQLCRDIRGLLRHEAQKEIEEAFVEFRCADEFNLADQNIFRIARAAVQGRIKKLIIADGINIFGKINPVTGSLAIHPGHLNHEDDDILDDLAQTVLARGGEVVVADKSQIPKGRPALAILYDQGTEAQMTHPYPINYSPREWRLSV